MIIFVAVLYVITAYIIIHWAIKDNEKKLEEVINMPIWKQIIFYICMFMFAPIVFVIGLCYGWIMGTF